MKKITLLCSLFALVCSQVLAQDPATPNNKAPRDAQAASQNKNIVISEGAVGRLSLQTAVSTKLSEVGDNVNAVLYEDVLGDDGRIAIAKGTQFYGRVTQVQRAKKGQKQASLKLTFENMLMPYGSEKVVISVTAIDDYANDEKYRAKNEEGQVEAGRSGGRTARNAGTGAGLGSMGGIFGGWTGMAIGAGAGAVAGVLMTKGNDLKLDQGTILRIRFERSLEVPAFDEDRRGIRRVE